MSVYIHQLERPIDWLSAQGFVSRDDDDFGALIELETNIVRRLATKLRKERGYKHSYALDFICKGLNFADYAHYVEHMKRKGLFETREELRERKRIPKRIDHAVEEILNGFIEDICNG